MRLIVRVVVVVMCTWGTMSQAMAAPPRAIMTGPTGGVPGDILVLDASESAADFYAWSVSPQLPGGRPTILVLEEGRKCLVASVPGVYHVFLACSNAEGIDQAQWTLTIGDEPNPTPVPPAPNPPTPTPPVPAPDTVPDGVFRIAKLAFDLAQLVDSTNRVGQAHALADAAEAVAASIAAGTLKKPQEILRAILAANNAALGTAMLAWTPWGTSIGLKLQELYKAGRLAQTGDWAVCLREIAIGLRAVK